MKVSRGIAIALPLLLVLSALLVVSAPARLLPFFVPADRLALAGLEGTVWSGSASRVLLRLEGTYLTLGAVRWQLQPLSLLAFAPRLTLQSRWGAQQVDGVVTFRGTRDLDLRDLDVRVDASLLRQLAPVAVDGQFSLLAPALDLRDGLPVSGRGRLGWENAAWLAPGGRQPLGSYAVDFSQPPGAALAGEVMTLRGPVEASGSLLLQGRDYRADVMINARQGLDPRLGRALSLVAAPEDNGYRLRLDGNLPVAQQ